MKVTGVQVTHNQTVHRLGEGGTLEPCTEFWTCVRLHWAPKWRCGACNKGKVNPKINSRCKHCKAIVSRVERA